MQNQLPELCENSLFEGSYELHAIIGRGRNSLVYKARRLPSENNPLEEGGEIVALKVLTGSSKSPELNVIRLKREAIALLASRHKNVIGLKDYVVSGELCYLSMELAERGDLREELNRHDSPFSAELTLNLIGQLLSGLEVIHKAGIVHRDIKPENLLLTADNTLHIADFGIALLPTEQIPLEEANGGIGTFDFLAPECLDGGQGSFSSDIYSVGVTMYNLLTKQMPYQGVSLAEQINNKMTGKRVPITAYLSEYPPLLVELIDRAMETNPEKRFKSASEFRDTIKLLLEEKWDPTAIVLSSNNEITTRPKTGQRRQLNISQDTLTNLSPKRSTLRLQRHHSRLRELSEQVHERVFKRSEVDEPQEVDLIASMANCPPAARQRATQTIHRGKLLKEIAAQAKRASRPRYLALAATAPLLIFLVVAALQAFDSDSALATPADKSSSASYYERVLHSFKSQLSSLFSGANHQQKQMLTSALRERPRTGALYNLLADDQQVALVVKSIESKGITIVALGLAGWDPQMIKTSTFIEDDEIILSGNGLTLALQIDRNSPAPGSILSGHYKDITSGREGPWVIW